MSPFDLNFRHLLALSAIAELGSLSRAGEAAHLSQPALTQGLVKLEGLVQHRLFDRRADGMRPTPAGAELVSRIDRAAGELGRGFGAAGLGGADGRAMLRRISFTHLRALLAAVESGNFVLANRTTGLSSPAIHRAVRDLERLSGLTLFERRGRSVAATRHARRLAAAARRAVAEVEAGLADLTAMRGESLGRVAVGAMPLARSQLIPEAVSGFHAVQPAATVSIVDGPYSELLGRLLAGELDLMVGALRAPHPSAEVVQTPLFEDALAVVARRGHPLAHGGASDAGRLAAFPWIMAPRSTPMRGAWEAMFRDAGIESPAPAVECSSVLVIQALLLDGDWLTLLSPEQVSREVEAGRLAIVGSAGPAGVRTIGVTTRVGWRPSALQAAFLDQLQARAKARQGQPSQVRIAAPVFE